MGFGVEFFKMWRVGVSGMGKFRVKKMEYEKLGMGESGKMMWGEMLGLRRGDFFDFWQNRGRRSKLPFLGVLRFCASDDIRENGKMSKCGGFAGRFSGAEWKNFGNRFGGAKKS